MSGLHTSLRPKPPSLWDFARAATGNEHSGHAQSSVVWTGSFATGEGTHWGQTLQEGRVYQSCSGDSVCGRGSEQHCMCWCSNTAYGTGAGQGPERVPQLVGSGFRAVSPTPSNLPPPLSCKNTDDGRQGPPSQSRTTSSWQSPRRSFFQTRQHPQALETRTWAYPWEPFIRPAQALSPEAEHVCPHDPASTLLDRCPHRRCPHGHQQTYLRMSPHHHPRLGTNPQWGTSINFSISHRVQKHTATHVNKHEFHNLPNGDVHRSPRQSAYDRIPLKSRSKITAATLRTEEVSKSAPPTKNKHKM